MVIIQLSGGLGNQLQQYALYKKFEYLGAQARLDVSWFKEGNRKEGREGGNGTPRELELDFFDNLQYQTCTRQERARMIGTEGIGGKLRRRLLPGTVSLFQESGMYHPEILGFRDMYLRGYFACEKYYGDILDRLRKEIRFPESQNHLNLRMAKQII